jgi:hypothetical protein
MTLGNAQAPRTHRHAPLKGYEAPARTHSLIDGSVHVAGRDLPHDRRDVRDTSVSCTPSLCRAVSRSTDGVEHQRLHADAPALRQSHDLLLGAGGPMPPSNSGRAPAASPGPHIARRQLLKARS